MLSTTIVLAVSNVLTLCQFAQLGVDFIDAESNQGLMSLCEDCCILYAFVLDAYLAVVLSQLQRSCIANVVGLYVFSFCV